jgi:hypothetical protein
MSGYHCPITDDDARLCLMVMALDPDTAGDYANAPVGMVSGIARPEFGIAAYDLACQICEAGWVGVPGDSCSWCAEAGRVKKR